MMMFRYFVTTTAVAAISLCLGPVSAGVVGSPGLSSATTGNHIVLAQGDSQQQSGDQSGQDQKKKKAKKKADPVQQNIDKYKKNIPQQYQQYLPGGGGAGAPGGL